MRVRVIEAYKDLEKKRTLPVNHEFDVTEERANALKDKGLVEVVEAWAVTEENDGVHVRPVIDGEIVDTPVEDVITEEEVQAVAKAIVEQSNETGETVAEVVNNIIDEAKENEEKEETDNLEEKKKTKTSKK